MVKIDSHNYFISLVKSLYTQPGRIRALALGQKYGVFHEESESMRAEIERLDEVIQTGIPQNLAMARALISQARDFIFYTPNGLQSLILSMRHYEMAGEFGKVSDIAAKLADYQKRGAFTSDMNYENKAIAYSKLAIEVGLTAVIASVPEKRRSA